LLSGIPGGKDGNMDIASFARGLALGFAVAAPVGPMSLLCIRRTLVGGFSAGVLSGLGVATADALYGAVAAFGPWLVGLTIITAANQWLYPRQNLVYLSLYTATEERAFVHSQVRPAAFAFAALTILGLAVSVPYWYALGLLR